jgi:ribA/ribD-fused uncharacterized protein
VGGVVSEPVLFWGGIYSQWYRSPFTVDGVPYRTAEHYMMAGKARVFGDTDSLEKIMDERDPSEAKKLGKLIKGWDDKVWSALRFQIVCRGSYEKFRQNPELMAQLIATGNREIVEASPYDRIWGVGLSEEDALAFWKKAQNSVPATPWPGLNLLGKALMVARDMLSPQ